MVMKKSLLSFLSLFLMINSIVFSQGQTCETAEKFCIGFSYLNTSNGSSAQLGPNYGCLSTQPNPVWYYMEIENSGVIQLSITQTSTSGSGGDLDVDFILWGPYNNYADAMGYCGNMGSDTTGNNQIIDCSYSASAVENATISNAQTGELYMIMVTNYAGSPGTITFTQTNIDSVNAGTVSCNAQDTCYAFAGSDRIVCMGDSTVLGASPTGIGAGNITYNWSPSATLDNPTLANPTATTTLTEMYYLTMTDDSGCVATDSVVIIIDSCITTNISQLNEKEDVAIYPNPSTGVFTISKPSSLKEKLTIRLYSLEGKLIIEKIFQQNEQSIVMDISEQSKGIYYLQLIMNDRTYTKKILKD